MNEYKTLNDNILYYKVYYDLGGYNFFTSSNRPRGYYLSIQRKRNGFAAFSDLSSPEGAIKYLLKEVNRQSKKALAEAEAEALPTLESIVAIYNERGIAL